MSINIPHRETCSPPKRILFCVRKNSKNGLDTAMKMFERYGDKHNISLYIEEPEDEAFADALLAKSGPAPDLIVVFGGDGTLLKFAKKFSDTPVLPINSGTVGFLSEFDSVDAEGALAAAFSGMYYQEKHRMLQTQDGTRGKPFYALNDITLTTAQPGTLISFSVTIDDAHVFDLRADGIIIATSLGSSAYAMSAGGPVIHPSLDIIELVPICPFMSPRLPLVLADYNTVEIKNTSNRRDAIVSVDGQSVSQLGTNESLRVTLSSKTVSLARFADSHFHRVKRKLLKNY